MELMNYEDWEIKKEKQLFIYYILIKIAFLPPLAQKDHYLEKASVWVKLTKKDFIWNVGKLFNFN